MPELPEVETIARDLAPRLVGRRILCVEKLDWERMVEILEPALFKALLADRSIEAVERRAKWLLLRLDAGWTLALHLRMSGSLAVVGEKDPVDAYTHLILALDDGSRLCFRDIRKFGRARMLDRAGLKALDAAHGPEPLGDAFSPEVLAEALGRRRTRLKPALLNQRIIAGLGNIYVDEALWQAGLHPMRGTQDLSGEEIRRLHEAIRLVLGQSILRRGSTFRDYRTGTGEKGLNQDHLSVYGRAGEPCPRCSEPIRRGVVAQRGTHWCDTCQRL